MTEPSPAQKALAAFNERHELCGPFDDDWVEQCLAAALRAAADQVVPPALKEEFNDRNQALPLKKMVEIRQKLNSIADELEAQ